MKYHLYAFILFINSYCNGQTFQRKHDPIYQTDFEIELVDSNSSFTVSRYKSPTELEYTLVLKAMQEKCPTVYGILLVLLNGEQISFPNHLIRCDAITERQFQLTGSFILTPELYKKLTEEGVAFFMLGEVKIPVQYKEIGESLPKMLEYVALD